jgi:4-carboxymuconolactone decarboxylase
MSEPPNGDSIRNRAREGRAVLESLRGDAPACLLEQVSEVTPDFERYMHEFVYGELFRRPGLAPRDRIIATLCCLVAMGGMEGPIELYVEMGLNVGISPDELVEVLLHCLSLVGFPRVQSALLCARRVFERRGVSVSRPQDSPE